MSETRGAPALDWLTARGGELRNGVEPNTWLVLLSGSPHYRLAVTPAKGRFACAVTQTVNGRRLDRGAEQADREAALAAGLAELREALGW